MSRIHTRDRAVNVTDGPLVKPLIVLSIPIVLTNLLQVGYNLADTFWVGRLGQPAISALSFSWAIIFLMISIAAGFTLAGTVLVAQHKGAGNLDRISRIAGQTITFIILVSAIFSVIGYIYAPGLLQLVGAPPGTEEFTLALEYTRTLFLGIPFVFAFFIFQALLQGWGDTKTPFYLMAFGVILNVLVDPFFILGFENNVVFDWIGFQSVEASLFAATGFTGFGVQGAAIATILTRGIGAFLGIGLLLFGDIGIRLSFDDFILRKSVVRKIFVIGAPASIERSTQALSVTLLTAIVALAGTEAVAGFGIGTRITSMVVLPALGMARGVETIVGQNLGANQPARAKQGVFVAGGLVVVSLLILSSFVYVFAADIIGTFITGEAAGIVIDIGTEYLQIVGGTYVFLGVFYIVQGGYRGSGSTRLAMVFSIIGLLVLRVPTAYGLGVWMSLGEVGVWYGIAIGNVLMVVISGVYFLRGTWAESVIQAPSPSEEPPSNPLFTESESTGSSGSEHD